MLIHTVLFFLLTWCHAALARDEATKPRALVSPMPREPTRWSRLYSAPGNHPVSYDILLHGEHFGELETKMTEIALSRGNWLKSSELEYYVAPSDEAISAVQDHLLSHGISHDDVTWSRFKDVVSVKADVARTAKLFDTELHIYHDQATGSLTAKTPRIVLPPSIAPHIVNVEGINTFSTPTPAPAKARGRGMILPMDSETIPSFPTGPSEPHVLPPGCVEANNSWPCVARFYGTDTFKPAPNSESAAVLSHAWKDELILEFERNLVPAANGYIPNKGDLSGDGSGWNNVTVEDRESLLDIQALIALSYPLNLSAYIASDTWSQNPRRLIDLPDNDRPGVVSSSFGIQEKDASEDESIAYCRYVQQLTALGTTYLAATADHGVSVDGTDPCPPFQVDFQSACPYVVSVGATTHMSAERAAYDERHNDVKGGWSSGGFSRRFAALPFQKPYLDKYLDETHLKNSPNFNASGRGFTDVSAIGWRTNVWTSMGPRWFAGASVSSPIFAAVLALINSKCKESGRPRVGWVHPTLYAHPEALYDITVGGSYDCGNTTLGFPCTPSWDPATGLGTPHFSNLLKAFGC